MSAHSITETGLDVLLDEEFPAAVEPVTIRELVARNVRRLRLAAEVTPDDIARASARFGLDWTVQWVSGVERGKTAVSAENLVGLAVVLTEAVGFRVGLADLLLGDEPVHLGKMPSAAAGEVAAAYLRELLTAEPARRAFSSPETPFASVMPDNGNALSRATAKMREISNAGLGDVDVRALSRAEAGASDLEEKLARKLGIAPIIVIAAAAGLWGRSMTEERDARLAEVTDLESEHYEPPKPTPIVRRLTTQLTARIKEAAQRREEAEVEARAAVEAQAAAAGTEPVEAAQVADSA